MMTIIEEFEQEQVAKLTAEAHAAGVRAGRHAARQGEGGRGRRASRLQAYEGVLHRAPQPRPATASFTVRKISYGEGVERVFPLYSPTIAEIEVVRRGEVRRAKLYYLRGRTRQVGAHRGEDRRLRRHGHGRRSARRRRRRNKPRKRRKQAAEAEPARAGAAEAS